MPADFATASSVRCVAPDSVTTRSAASSSRSRAGRKGIGWRKYIYSEARGRMLYAFAPVKTTRLVTLPSGRFTSHPPMGRGSFRSLAHGVLGEKSPERFVGIERLADPPDEQRPEVGLAARPAVAAAANLVEAHLAPGAAPGGARHRAGA